MPPPLLLQTAAATVTQAPMPNVMTMLGVVTAVFTLVLAVCAACVYAYKLGGLKRDGEATRADTVNANVALSIEVHNGFKTIHRRIDKLDAFNDESQRMRVTWQGWRSEIDGRVERVEGDVQDIKRTLEDERRVGPHDRREP